MSYGEEKMPRLKGTDLIEVRLHPHVLVRLPERDGVVTAVSCEERDSPMDTFADRVKVLQSESERIKQYLHALPPRSVE